MVAGPVKRSAGTETGSDWASSPVSVLVDRGCNELRQAEALRFLLIQFSAKAVATFRAVCPFACCFNEGLGSRSTTLSLPVVGSMVDIWDEPSGKFCGV